LLVDREAIDPALIGGAGAAAHLDVREAVDAFEDHVVRAHLECERRDARGGHVEIAVRRIAALAAGNGERRGESEREQGNEAVHGRIPSCGCRPSDARSARKV